MLIEACVFRHVNMCLYIFRNMHLHTLGYVCFQMCIYKSTCFGCVYVQSCILEYTFMFKLCMHMFICFRVFVHISMGFIWGMHIHVCTYLDMCACIHMFSVMSMCLQVVCMFLDLWPVVIYLLGWP